MAGRWQQVRSGRYQKGGDLGTSGVGRCCQGCFLTDLSLCHTAVAEVSEQLGKSLIKFCSGDLGPESILPDTQLLDRMLSEAPTTPVAQAPGKGMDGKWRGSCHLSPLSSGLLAPNACFSRRSAVLHLYFRDYGAS